MSDLKVIKKKILQEDKIEVILEAMGCEHIQRRGNRIEAQLPEKFQSTNKRACQVKLNDSLTSSIRNKPEFKGGDIFSLVSFIENDKRGDYEIDKDLYKAKRFICMTLGWTKLLKDGEFITKKDYVAPLKALMGETTKSRNNEPNTVFGEDILDEYLPYPSYDWFVEGISFKAQRKWQIGYDMESERITIPMRNEDGGLIGVKGRILKDAWDDRKYLYLYNFRNSIEWFNMWNAKISILENKKVFIFEGEKSPMKMFDYGYNNAIAIGSSEISDTQAKRIMNLGLDIDIVLCYDKGISTDEIKEQAKRFKGREVYAVYDHNNILGDKMSPVDMGKDVWETLLDKNCYSIQKKR